MRTLYDAQRSIGFYVYQALGEDWSISFQREDTLDRPHAVIRAVGPITFEGSSFRNRDYLQPISVHLFPELKPEKHYEETQMAAAQLGDQFLQALVVGQAPDGYPNRIPLRNYDGIGLGEPSPNEFDGYLRVSDQNMTYGPDPDDDKFMMVVVTFRARWRAADGEAPHALNTYQRTGTPYPITTRVSGVPDPK